MKIFSSIFVVGITVATIAHQTNYAHSGLWIDWNPDYGILVNGAVNAMIVGGCFVAGWLVIAAVDAVIEKTMPDSVAVSWRRLVG